MLKIIIALAVVIVLNSYGVLRLVSRWPWAQQHIMIVVVITLAFIAMQLMGPFGDRLLFPKLRHNSYAATAFAVIDWLSYIALGLASTFFIYSLATDIVTLAWKLIALPRDIVNFDRRTFLTLGAITLGSTIAGIGQAVAGPTVKRVTIPLANLPAGFDGFTIAQISDLHVGPTIGRAYTENVVKIVNDLKPDLIALTGDFIDGTIDSLRDAIAPLADLSAPHGTFFVTGNHEYYWGAAAWCDHFRTLGIRVFANDHDMIRRGDDEIILAGVTDYSTLHGGNRPDASDPKRALTGAPANRAKILLAHQPATYAMAHDAGFDLQLSGHTHSGQYFPFSLFIRFFQRYYKGLNRHENMWVYVNRGTGYWGPPLRTGVPSEITLITLKTV